MPDDHLLVVTALTDVSLCLDCLVTKIGLALKRVEQILGDFATGISTHPERRACTGCREIRMTYRMLG